MIYVSLLKQDLEILCSRVVLPDFSISSRDLKFDRELSSVGVCDVEAVHALLALDEEDPLTWMALLSGLNILHGVREAIAGRDINCLLQEVMLLIHPHQHSSIHERL